MIFKLKYYNISKLRFVIKFLFLTTITSLFIGILVNQRAIMESYNKLNREQCIMAICIAKDRYIANHGTIPTIIKVNKNIYELLNPDDNEIVIDGLVLKQHLSKDSEFEFE